MARLGSRGLRRATALLALWAAATGSSTAAGESPTDLVLSIDSPQTEGKIGAPLGLALVTGRARTSEVRALDLVIALDTSHSTAARARSGARGWRHWLAWLLGPVPEAAAPSPLESGIGRALALLDALGGSSARVGVVAFAGTASTAAPLGDAAAARVALRSLSRRGSSGATNLIDALERARIELCGELGAASRARAGARRVAVLITDGVDVHPLYPDPQEARALLRTSAARLHAAGVELELVATAHAADPVRAGIAEAGGSVRAPDAALESLQASDAALISIRNSSSGSLAHARAGSDGRFAALVQLQPGANRLEIRARIRSGPETARVLELVWNPSGPDPELPLALLRIRNQLLAGHLHALHARSRTRALSIAPED